MINKELYEAAKQALFGTRELWAVYNIHRVLSRTRKSRNGPTIDPKVSLHYSHLTSFQPKIVFYNNVERLRIQLWTSLMMAETCIAREMEKLIFQSPNMTVLVLDFGNTGSKSRSQAEIKKVFSKLRSVVSRLGRLESRKVSVLLERGPGKIFDSFTFQ